MKSGCSYNLAIACLAIGLTWFARRRTKEYMKTKILEIMDEIYKKDWSYHD